MLTKYIPSGTVSVRFAVGAVLVLLFAAIAGAVYQVALDLMPLIYGDFAIVVGMAALTGALLPRLSRPTHCRNPSLGATLGFAVGVVLVVTSHYTQYQINRPKLIASVPDKQRAAVDAALGFTDYLKIRAENGWVIGRAGSNLTGGGDITGVMVYVLWGFEAVALITGSIIGGVRAAKSPYCEPCGAWISHDMLTVDVIDPALSTLSTVQNASSFDGLVPPESEKVVVCMSDDERRQAKKTTSACSSRIHYKVTSCPRCKMAHAIAIHHEATRVRGNKTDKVKNVLHERVLLTSEQVSTLAELKNAPAS